MSSSETLKLPENTNEPMQTTDRSGISLYRKGTVSEKTFYDFKKNVLLLFPKTPMIFFSVIKTATARDSWSDRKFIDAAQTFFEKKHYGAPQPAEFLEYDKTIKTYTYNEATALCSQANPMDKMFDCVKIGGTAVWVEKGQKARFNLKGCEGEKNADKR